MEEEKTLKVWNVYRNPQTKICSVAKDNPGAYNHKHGPDSWQKCWDWIRKYCEQQGGNWCC